MADFAPGLPRVLGFDSRMVPGRIGRAVFIGIELAKHPANSSSERIDISAEECSKGFGAAGAGYSVVKMSAVQSGPPGPAVKNKTEIR